MNEEMIYEVEEPVEVDAEVYEIEESHGSVLPVVIGGVIAAGAGVGALVYKKFGGKEKLAEIKEARKEKKIEKLQAKLEKLNQPKKSDMVQIVEAKVIEE